MRCKVQNDAKACQYDSQIVAMYRCTVHTSEIIMANNNNHTTCWKFASINVTSTVLQLPKVVNKMQGHCGGKNSRWISDGNYKSNDECLQRCRLQNDATGCMYWLQKCFVYTIDAVKSVKYDPDITCWNLEPIDD